MDESDVSGYPGDMIAREAAMFGHMPGQQRNDDFSKWQLETEMLIDTITKTLMGFDRIENPNTNGFVWAKDTNTRPLLSQEGAFMLKNQLRPIMDKGVFLSNIPEDKINLYTREIIGEVTITLCTDMERYGLVDDNGVPDENKLYQIKSMLETPVYAALCRSNSWKTFEGMNKQHEIKTLITAPQSKKRFQDENY